MTILNLGRGITLYNEPAIKFTCKDASEKQIEYLAKIFGKHIGFGTDPYTALVDDEEKLNKLMELKQNPKFSDLKFIPDLRVEELKDWLDKAEKKPELIR